MLWQEENALHSAAVYIVYPSHHRFHWQLQVRCKPPVDHPQKLLPAAADLVSVGLPAADMNHFQRTCSVC